MWTNAQNLALLERARAVIPGGMYGHQSTGMLPREFPQYFQRASGSRLWDVDGNEYIDYLCAYGPNLFGYRNPVIEQAAMDQTVQVDSATGPAPVMVELAELLVSMISHADWAMFCKNGTDATSIAMMCARAYRGRNKIIAARGAYHGCAPWSTPLRAGTTHEDQANVIFFDYDDIESLNQAVKKAGSDLAGIIATPFWHEVFVDQFLPTKAYAQAVRRLCDEHDALMIVDEVRAGFRLSRDCSWGEFGVQPDLSAWGKAIANGYPLSAVLGSEKVRQAASSIYVTGTFWFQAVPMAAAVATLKIIRSTDYLKHIQEIGEQFRVGLEGQASAAGFRLRQSGPSQMPQILFEDDPDLRVGYAWARETLKGGILVHPYHNMFVSAAMTTDDVRKSLDATARAFELIKRERDHLPAPTNASLLKRLEMKGRLPAHA
ncbi:aminotransferase class III-fold pyridoxal phosphate-dependent enzyme [Burkholderia pseudomultivorans]|uniref:Aminopentol aminotransferase n=1 Tax=Burkholderia pseudomultivorans TaxID=1207504 RepID=A0A6P2MXS0_9BURK|nr:aminotransferase class III-fold pyridoxal phosphate-dependent enzyme [Burkholderia pseudomultivorans]MDR8730108.1 Aminopentol aminotransferase [Burkholderia pseudomultivorans]MDR8734693.1 Aminopentol aminotransferase [Burkholderia pseudomultivorans]MDR8740659.1 Aminopentol aminotransferase [Burkholderia pseudomultivorans]MDR8751676.1 Aminopentol aminotransferase [Burkholderia pseudomultivorans]MDR8777073.1 Aminopentol aminotransferase [Burkholderia pseudomultivorans]